MCMFESRYQYGDWLYAMTVILWDVIEGDKKIRTGFPMQHSTLIS